MEDSVACHSNPDGQHPRLYPMTLDSKLNNSCVPGGERRKRIILATVTHLQPMGPRPAFIPEVTHVLIPLSLASTCRGFHSLPSISSMKRIPLSVSRRPSSSFLVLGPPASTNAQHPDPDLTNWNRAPQARLPLLVSLFV